MKKFKTTTTVEHELTITIDECIWDEQALKDYSEVMIPVDDLEDLAKYVSEMIATNDECSLKGVRVTRRTPPYYQTEIE